MVDEALTPRPSGPECHTRGSACSSTRGERGDEPHLSQHPLDGTDEGELFSRDRGDYPGGGV